MEESLGVAFVSCDPGRDRWNTVMVGSKYERGHRASADKCRVPSNRKILQLTTLASSSMITLPQDWTMRLV